MPDLANGRLRNEGLLHVRSSLQPHLLPGILREHLATVRGQKGLEDIASIPLQRLDFAPLKSCYSSAISAARARYPSNSVCWLCTSLYLALYHLTTDRVQHRCQGRSGDITECFYKHGMNKFKAVRSRGVLLRWAVSNWQLLESRWF